MIDPTMPLIDLHRHLDGSVRLETILELADQHGIELPASSVEDLRPHVVVSDSEPGLMAFIARFRWLTAILANGPRALRAQKALLADWETLDLDRSIAAGIDRFAAAFESDEPARMMAPHLKGR